jgi:glycine hydroxymethyltransferase
MPPDILTDQIQRGFDTLRLEDPALYTLLRNEQERQMHTLTLVASSSFASPSTLACMATTFNNLTAEGYPSKRFHSGCQFADEIEDVAIERAKRVFSARYANVQPHSGTTANQIVLCSVLKPGDRVMGMGLRSGGHLSHGSKASFTGQWFDVVEYNVNEENLLDYDVIYELACMTKPKLIIAGASSYPRLIDFKKFRAIADEVGALLLADISHIAGLVAAGVHSSPIDDAHFTTTSTYKQLYGPRGGLILSGKDYDSLAPDGKSTLADLIQKSTFPFFQGTPSFNIIAAKARGLGEVMRPEFKVLMETVVKDARALAQSLLEHGYTVLTDGTDNHIVLVDVAVKGMTGLVAEQILETCQILVNRNLLPRDQKSAHSASGIRLGTNSLAARGFGTPEMALCAKLIDSVLSMASCADALSPSSLQGMKRDVIETVERLCMDFPIKSYGSGEPFWVR